MLKASKWNLLTIHFNYSVDTDDSELMTLATLTILTTLATLKYFEFKLALNILCLGVCTSMAPSIGQFTMGKKK